MPPITPPRVFGGHTGKSPEFSFGGSPDEGSQGRFNFNVPRPSHRAESSRDGSSTLNEPAGLAALVAEMRDVKELLRAVLLEKTPAQQQDNPPNHKTGDLMASPLYVFYDESEILNLARNHCPNEEGMALFRDHFLSQFGGSGEWVEEVDRTTAQSNQLVFSCQGPEDAVLRIHRPDPSQSRPANRPYFRWPERKGPGVRRSLKSDDAKYLVEAEWPVSLAQGVKIDGKICLRWKVRLDLFKVSWRILYLHYGNDGVVACDRFDHSLLMSEIEDGENRPLSLPLAQLSHEVISPGKIWLLNPCHESAINFDQLSFLSAILLHPWDMSSSLVFSEPLDGGNQYTIALDTICSFAGPWKPMHLRRRICLLGEPGKSEGESDSARFSFYRRHEIRCFSSRDPYFMGLKYGDGPTDSYLRGNRHLPHQFPTPSHAKPTGLATSRQSGIFPTLLEGVERRFTEKRLSVVCLASDFNYASSMPSFRIMVFNDFPEISGLTEDDFRNWKTSGLKIEGPASWQMAYQATISHLIPIWEREWASCLDELDNSVRVKMEEIMDPNTKESMMFDASFRRSRFYFEVIQMLRIFSDMIRETGRDLQTMIADPHMASHLSWYDDHDEVSRENSKRILRGNWDIIDAQQRAAERRLLDRITELSGDMQSLRDGY